MQSDGVQRVLDFVRRPAGKAADRGEAVGDVQLRLEFASGGGVAQRYQRADSFVGGELIENFDTDQ